jgi:hypothetical protein
LGSKKYKMKRKFDSARLYKLTKRVIIIIAVISFFIFILREVNYKDYAKQRNDWILNCMKIARENKNYDGTGRCLIYAGEDTYNQTTSVYFAFGVLLPIVFFGSKWIYKYIFPTKEAFR